MRCISPHVSFQLFHVAAMYLSNLMQNYAYWTSALAEGSYNFSPVRSSVRYGDFSKTVHYFFLKFYMEFRGHKHSKVTEPKFSKKICPLCWVPKWAVFGPKIDIIQNISKTLHQIFFIFSIMQNQVKGLNQKLFSRGERSKVNLPILARFSVDININHELHIQSCLYFA